MKKSRLTKKSFKKAMSILGNGVEKICNNCRLYNRDKSECRIVVLHEGERYNLPVHPGDSCFFDTQFTAIKEELKNDEIVKTAVTFNPADEIKSARYWVEDPVTGQPAEEGIVKMEYDKDFFGKIK